MKQQQPNGPAQADVAKALQKLRPTHGHTEGRAAVKPESILAALESARDQCEADLAALEARAAELLSPHARHILFELCEPDFAWGHPEHNYLALDPWHDRDAKLELVDADMIEYGEPTGMDGLGCRTLTISRWGRAVSAHCLPLLLAARDARPKQGDVP